jgi:hypothetical protein
MHFAVANQENQGMLENSVTEVGWLRMILEKEQAN